MKKKVNYNELTKGQKVKKFIIETLLVIATVAVMLPIGLYLTAILPM